MSPNAEPKRKALLLEDNLERVAMFRAALKEAFPDWELKVWHDAPTMLREMEDHFDEAALISLDHDLNPQPGVTRDPGTGRDVAKHLSGHMPVAPVIIHSTNVDAAWSMHNDLRFAGWKVDRVGPIGEDWARKLWLPKAREFAESASERIEIRRRAGHATHVEAALESLDGLAIGDALGEMLSYRYLEADAAIERGLPPGPWMHTDDTEMAIAIVEVLRRYGYVHQDALARRFAWWFELDPLRGYGSMTRIQMAELLHGEDWRVCSAAAFGGQGSMGNGAAMRVAPLGAFFADDLARVVEEARNSAVVTHSHPEGVAGAIAVAVAAAVAAKTRTEATNDLSAEIFSAAADLTPESKVGSGIKMASQIAAGTSIHEVARVLGNGLLVTAPDTAPFAIWCAAHHLKDYRKALATTINGGGDCDTNAAIVGGIVAAHVGRDGIPLKWRMAKEKLPFDQ